MRFMTWGRWINMVYAVLATYLISALSDCLFSETQFLCSIGLAQVILLPESKDKLAHECMDTPIYERQLDRKLKHTSTLALGEDPQPNLRQQASLELQYKQCSSPIEKNSQEVKNHCLWTFALWDNCPILLTADLVENSYLAGKEKTNSHFFAILPWAMSF